MKNVSSLILGASLLTLVACGNDSSSSSPKAKTNLLVEAGHFKATLSSLNEHLAGDVSGEAYVKVKGDLLSVEVKVNGAPAQIVHAQSIRSTDVCPTLSSDINKDGIIDAVEGRKSYGPALIPLDGDLKTQLEAGSTYPRADFSGNYYYKQSVSYLEMMKDLTLKDNDTSDDVVKLGNTGLNLVGRNIVIYGIAATTALPDSVAAAKGQTKQASLPIACGTFEKINVVEEDNSNGVKD